ncbi:MAG: helix-turn-helix domain containing protein [Proteobacteria bacterium]|nr:helix-turn-helix domain containing protein [Pseudomonadota bacterium]
MTAKKQAVDPEPDDARRDILLRQLEAIYVVEGYRRSTMADLATRLRCSKRALYQLAPSKEELFLIVVQQVLDEIWRLGLEAESQTEQIQNRIHSYVTAAIVPCKRWSPVFLADVEAMPEAHELLERHLRERMERL